jgi:Pentapeptide repeats (8 copies)
MQLRRVLLIIGGCTATLTVLIVLLISIPKLQVASLPAKGVNAEDVFKDENDARATLAQILGGFAVLVGLYFAWTNITATKEGLITDRFYKAIEQLGATDDKGEPKLELRLGGIYALERIARDSERDHWPIMEVLTAYVRKHAAYVRENEAGPVNRHPLAIDIQAILTVISRREWSYEKSSRREWTHEQSGQNLELHGTDLHDGDLEGVHLKNAYLMRTHLERANLMGANLKRAILALAHLEKAQLEGAHLEEAVMGGAYLTGAWLTHAHLEKANLGLANLDGAHLEGADLTGSYNLTQQQVNSAIGDATTKLPSGLVMPESWKRGASG